MSCCDTMCSEKEIENLTVGFCKECGSPIDEYGDSLDVCSYSPKECEKCGWRPCDSSC